MSEIYEQTMHQRVIAADRERERRQRGWLVIFDYVYYALIVVGVIGFLYYLFFFRDLLVRYLPVFLQGTLVTLVVSLISMVFAVVFGFAGALGRLSRYRVLRWLAAIYVEVIRGTPMLVQLLLWFYGVRFVLSSVGFSPYNTAFQIMTVLQNNSLVPDYFDNYFYGVLALSFNYGAYLTEVFRAGILSVDKGQTEAGLSLGLNSRQILRDIVLPQAIRNTVPPFTNNFITLVQDSALLSVISVLELEHQTFALALPQVDSNDKMFVFIFGALFYLLLCYPLSLLARVYEKRLAQAYDDR